MITKEEFEKAVEFCTNADAVLDVIKKLRGEQSD